MPSPNPFEITATEIEALPDEHQLVRLVNRLIWDEGHRIRVPPENIKITQRIHDPDGGADAITDAGTREGRYIDSGTTAWQFKKRWRGPAALRRELRKKAVQEVFQHGGSYTLVLGQGMAPKRYAEREAQLKEIASGAGCKGNVRLFVADHVAGWASIVPAALFELRPAIREYYRADQFLQREPRHAIEFVPDEVRKSTIDAIDAALFSDQATSIHVRIQGQAGVGKSRLALELVKHLGVDTLALYSPNVPSSELFGWVAANQNVQATVIVDECDEAVAIELESRAQQCEGRFRLITVGPGSSTGRNVYPLDVLDKGVMERVVRAVSSTLTQEQVRWVAAKTEGYVKFAVAVAQAIVRGAASMEEMSTDMEVRQVVSRLLVPEPEGRLALSGVALLSRVGWNGDLANEGQAVAKFIGIDWNRMQHALGPAIQDGIVVVKGRYWYVSPELLALWLAAQVWGTQTHRVAELHDSLPSETSRSALLERLSQLDLPSVRNVLDELLGERGPFRDIESIDNARVSRLYSVIARGAPDAAKESLTRIFNSVSDEQLLEFKNGRRDIIWTLEDQAQRRETFFEAARLLRRLAEAENEHWSNNATGVWNSLFLTHLAQTEVPAVERLSLVEEALSSDSTKAKSLAVSALSSALQGAEFGMALRDSESVPRGHWRPRTWGEFWEVKRRALTLLQGALEDSSPEIQGEAKDVFLSHARTLVHQGLAEEVVTWFAKLDIGSEAERRRMWESIEDVLRYASDGLSDEQQRRLRGESKRFYGDSLPDRIKRYTGGWSHVDWPSEGEPEENRPERVAERLADEAVSAMDQVLPILPWLASGEAEQLWPFIRRLGKVDADRRWLHPLLQAAKEGKDSRVLSGYLAGRAQAGDEEWQEDLLDQWSDDESLAVIVFDATVRGTPTDGRAARLLKLLDRKWVEPSTLGWLPGWPRGLSQRYVAELVRRLLQEDTSTSIEGALMLLSNWLEDVHRELDGELEDLAWQAVERPHGWGGRAMLGLYWRRLANHLLPRDPVRIARAVARMFTEGEASFHDERLQILEDAIRVAPSEVWNEVGNRLLSNGNAFRLMWALGESGIVSRVPEEALVDWVKQKGAKGAGVVAQSVKPAGERLPAIVRVLLSEHSKSVGGILAANFRSGVWSGSEVNYLDAQIAQAKQWQQDEEPAVSAWATSLVQSLQSSMASARVRDEEDELL